MHEITAQVLDVTGRQSKNGQHTMYDVAMSDGNKYTTFDADLANKAVALKGQIASAHVEIKQNERNGKSYTNYDLKDIGPQGTLAAVPVAVGTPAIPVTNGATSAPSIPISLPSSSGGFSDEDKRRVTKLACLGTAFEFVGDLFSGAGPEAIVEAKEQALELAKELYGQAFSSGAQQAVPATPAEVAAAVPGVQVGVETAAAPTQPAGVQW